MNFFKFTNKFTLKLNIGIQYYWLMLHVMRKNRKTDAGKLSLSDRLYTG